MADAQQLELALERALRNAGEPQCFEDDARVVARVLRRWHGDDAARVLKAAIEITEADNG